MEIKIKVRFKRNGEEKYIAPCDFNFWRFTENKEEAKEFPSTIAAWRFIQTYGIVSDIISMTEFNADNEIDAIIFE